MIDPVDALNENQVVDYVCSYLSRSGYRIDRQLDTKQKGDDIVAVRETDGLRLLIEAKGATSARENSYKFGSPFESSAVRVHVAEAVFKAVQTVSSVGDGENARAGIALPDNRNHRRLMASVEPVLTFLGVAVFWVTGDGNVTVDSSWAVPA